MKINGLGPQSIAQDNLNKVRSLAENKPEDLKQIKQLSKDFEAIFLQIVLKSMRDSVQKGGLIDGGNGEEIFKSMLDGEYAKAMTTQDSNGIASSIESFLLRQGKYEQKLSQNLGIKKYQDK